jgi:hypothetical protein
MTLVPTDGLPTPRAPEDDPAVRFFKLILPTRGFLVAAIKRKTGRGFQHIFCETPEELWEIIEEADRDGYECYFACSSFKQPLQNQPGARKAERLLGRTHHNVCVLKAFWPDIDVGKDKPYKTRDEALAALAAFVKKSNLPKPIVVGSGGDKSGLHVYWPLAQDIDRGLWLYYACGLKILCGDDKHGLHADRMRTADPSSVLRPPGTHNRKHGPEVLVEVNARDLEIEPYPLDQFDIFAKHSPLGDPRRHDSVTNKQRQPKRQTKRQTNGNGHGPGPRLLADARCGEVPPSHAAEIVKHCGQLQYLRDQGDKIKIEEPLWYAFMGLLGRCVDGEELAHKLSEGDARYNWEETQGKLEQWRAAVTGATTCERFHELNPSICEKCKYWKEINSPYKLGIIPSTGRR